MHLMGTKNDRENDHEMHTLRHQVSQDDGEEKAPSLSHDRDRNKQTGLSRSEY